VTLPTTFRRHFSENRKVATDAGARFWLVDTVCSDVALHRQRFETRGPVWRCDVGQTWAMVDGLRIRFQAHPQAAFIADAVRSVDENVRSIMVLLGGGASPVATGLFLDHPT
jgi:hypothetical protein